MRGDTKLAIVVAVVCIGFGAWYITSGKKSKPDNAKPSKSTVAKNPDKKTAEQKKPPRLARNKRNDRAGTETADARTRNHQSKAGSPAPKANVGKQTTEPMTTLHRPQPVSTPLPQDPAAAEKQTAANVTKPKSDRVGTADPDNNLGAMADAAQKPVAKENRVGMASAQPLAGTTTKPAALATPTATIQPDKKPAANTTITHTIQRGDTFTALAVKYLGHAKYAGKIAEANPDLDARRLFVGAKVTIPMQAQKTTAAKPTPAASTASIVESQNAPAAVVTPPAIKVAPVPPDRAYKVKPGEGWYTLAQRFLGNGANWTELYELNKGRVPRNPSALAAGTVIELPAGVKTGG